MKKLFTAILTTVLFFGLNAVKAQTSIGQMTTFPTYGGPDANAYYIPGAGSKVVIMYHDWHGLTENAKKDAQNWYEALDGAVTIYMVDLYDGKTAVSDFESKKLMNNLDNARAEAIVNGIIQRTGSGKEIATLGWGIGGTWAFNTASILGTKAIGCAMIYGYPVKDDARIAQNRADVVYIGGVSDDVVNKAEAEQFKAKVAATGRSIQQRFFAGKHGYANIGDPNYSPVDAGEVQVVMVRFLKHKMAL